MDGWCNSNNIFETPPKSFAKSSVKQTNKQGVCHTLAICIKKYLKAKEELWKFKYFTMPKYIIFKTLQMKPKSFKIS
jgi:hypothetical protein